MGIEERRARDRAARRELIIGTARKLAEAEGWDAVTTRRLSTEIEYSQPVLYKHFSGMDEIAHSVATDGFGELAEKLREARSCAQTPEDGLRQVAQAYMNFSRENPALYDAMFIRATTLRFASADTPPQLSAAFNELRETITAVVREPDADTFTEVFWAALHGLAALARSGRLRPRHDSHRVEVLVSQFSAKR